MSAVTRIGLDDVDNKLIEPAIDSSPLLALSDHTALYKRFNEHGYLAFSNFFPVEDTEAAVTRIMPVLEEHLDKPASFDAGFLTGECWKDDAELRQAWIDVANSAEMKRLYEADKVSTTLNAIFACEPGWGQPEIRSELSWIRGKHTGGLTPVHVDYHYMRSRPDVLEHDEYTSFTIWTNLTGSIPQGQSCLCVAPGSHKLPFAPNSLTDGDVNTCPKVFREQMEQQKASWHILNETSNLHGPGTFVMMSLRLVHAATPNLTNDYRISMDSRFRCMHPHASNDGKQKKPKDTPVPLQPAPPPLERDELFMNPMIMPMMDPLNFLPPDLYPGPTNFNPPIMPLNDGSDFIQAVPSPALVPPPRKNRNPMIMPMRSPHAVPKLEQPRRNPRIMPMRSKEQTQKIMRKHEATPSLSKPAPGRK